MTAPQWARSMLNTLVSKRRRLRNALSTLESWLPNSGACKSSLDSRPNFINYHSLGMTPRVELSTSVVFLPRCCSPNARSYNHSRLTDQCSISAFISSYPVLPAHPTHRPAAMEDGRPKGYSYIEYNKLSDAVAACEDQGTKNQLMFYGKPLHVAFASP
jgi:hypothetical protein